MKKIILIFLTLFNYGFLLYIFIINYLGKIDIGNDPLLGLLFFIYLITIINSLITLGISNKQKNNLFYSKLKLINKIYIFLSLSLIIILGIIL